MKIKENFLELCIEEVYCLIVEDDHWPNNLTRIQKFYEKRDTVSDYKRCATLQQHIDIYQYETTGSLERALN